MLVLSTFAVCLVSALFPLVNAEAYLGAIAAVGDGSALWPLAVTAALGQTCGKIVFFQLGRSSLNWRWVRKKTESTKWQDRIARWQQRTESRPWTATGLIGASALLGVPPLAIISVVAGQLRVPFTLFVISVLAGRTLRFAAVLGGVAALNLP